MFLGILTFKEKLYYKNRTNGNNHIQTKYLYQIAKALISTIKNAKERLIIKESY